MSDPRPLAQRLAVFIWRAGFWLPLLLCTYLALVPEPPDNPVFRLSDVILHAAAFTYLTFAFVLMATATGSPGSARGLHRGMAIRAFLVMLGYGIFLEVVQSFVPERTAELRDLGVDVLGIGAGLLLAAVLAGPLAALLDLLLGRVVGAFSR